MFTSFYSLSSVYSYQWTEEETIVNIVMFYKYLLYLFRSEEVKKK